MATLKNEAKLKDPSRENFEKHPRSNLAQNSNVLRTEEDYITHVSAEIESRVTEKLSQEFRKTESLILGALYRPDDYLLKPLIQGYSGTDPETSRNTPGTNQGTNEDNSQSDPHPGVGVYQSQMTPNSGPDDNLNLVTGVQKEILCYHDKVIRVQKRNHLLLP